MTNQNQNIKKNKPHKLELYHLIEQVDVMKSRLPNRIKTELINIKNCRRSPDNIIVKKCFECGNRETEYASCHKRSCPKCSYSKQSKWIINLAKNLYPVKHFHVVFTIPHEFNSFFLYNKSAFSDILMKATSKTIKDTIQTKYNVKAGHTSVLHTWGSALTVHPHVHMIVPAGGISNKDGSWISFKKDFLIFQDVLSLYFRKVFMKKIKKFVRDAKTILPPDLQYLNSEAALLDFFNEPHSKKWHVYTKKHFNGEMRIVKYLGRYTHRIAISNSRFRKLKNGKVTFQYKNYKANKLDDQMTLDVCEFIRRFTSHISEKGFVRVRHGGIYAGSLKSKYLERAQKHVYGEIGRPLDKQKEIDSLEETYIKFKEKFYQCIECEGEVEILEPSYLKSG